MSARRRVLCSCHCAACGTHFSSLRAFELHRNGDFATGRYCIEPLDDDRFAPKDERGACKLGQGEKSPVIVWTLRASLARSPWRAGRELRRAA